MRILHGFKTCEKEYREVDEELRTKKTNQESLNMEVPLDIETLNELFLRNLLTYLS